MVSNGIIFVVLKFNKCEINEQKKLFYWQIKNMCLWVFTFICVYHLLDFDTSDIILFDTKYFFIEERLRQQSKNMEKASGTKKNIQ